MAALYTIALAGNPNCGKTTLFNALTGSQQHVGNWPGKTVERKEGTFQVADQEIAVVDLPGTYSLNAFSAEEIIARDYIVEAKPQTVVAVVDSANLERNLYLVVQLLEMGAPLILALNMTDVAERRNIRIDQQHLSERLGGIPVISTVGSREVGLDTLKQAICQTTARQIMAGKPVPVHFDPAVEQAITALQPLIEQDPNLNNAYPSRWLAIKLLEADDALAARAGNNSALIDAVQKASAAIVAATGEDPDTLIADGRYTFIGEVVRSAVVRPETHAVTASDKVDRLLTHPIWGVPIFLFFMWLVFQFTANVSAPFLDWIDGVFSVPVTNWAVAILSLFGLNNTWVESLVTEGIIAGVGGVLVFVPVLFSLYLGLALLEDSGYMARAAFVMERFMLKLGLHGKSFLPMLVGFGCTVPGIYATRTLENETDRKITGFLTTFMSCGARLPVYVVFGAAFFGASSGNLIFAMYGIGIGVAVITSLLLTRVAFKDREAPLFVMELPPYRMPNRKTVIHDIRQRIGDFIHHAGTVILFASIGLWFLTAIPVSSSAGNFDEVDSSDSLFGAISQTITPVFAPAGFGNWEATSSLMTGFLAKEVIISTMNQIYVGETESNMARPTFGEDLASIGTGLVEATILTGQELVNIVPRTLNIIPGLNMPEASFLGGGEAANETALESALRNAFTPLAAVAFNVFVLLYVPCMASVGAMRHEFGTRWALLQVVYTLMIAWVAAVIVYQGGLLLGLGGA